MCLIVVKKSPSATFSDEKFQRSYSRNSDGMGIMFVEDGRVKVERVLGNLAMQEALYRKHKNKPMFCLHHRLATHGDKTTEKMLANCHPYKIFDMDDGDAIDLYMMHNGVISDALTTDKTMSDTWNFIQNQVKPVLKADASLLWNKGFQTTISKAIGANNKLVFLSNVSNYDKLVLINESSGTVQDGCWLSNTYSTAAPVQYNNNASTYAYGKRFSEQNKKEWEYEDEWDDYSYSGRSRLYLPKEEKVQVGEFEYMHGEWKKDGKSFKSYVAMEEYCKQKALDNSKKEEDNAATIEYKADLRRAVLAGELRLAEVQTELTEEEYAELSEEYDTLIDSEVENMSLSVRAIYDPENVDTQALKNLIDKAFKEFTFNDCEVLIDAEPQVAADVLEFLLNFYAESNKTAACAA